jgi:membrane-bound serine protease (ClpP class)
LASAAQTVAPGSAVNGRAGTVTVLEINGPIGPATSRYIERGIQAAQTRGSRLVVLQMDTPGGLDTSMRDIIRAILASTIPVATYVAPPGARAASAGTYIMYASHIAAMAPATNVGAATPVSIGGEPTPAPGGNPSAKPDRDKPDAEKPTDEKGTGEKGGGTASGDSANRDKANGENARSERANSDKANSENASRDKASRDKANSENAGREKRDNEKPGASPFSREPATAMERKAINDAVAYLRGLAELRGRNADWAEDAVRNAASLSATDALSKHVTDIIARDLPDLLAQIDGREVQIANRPVKLATRGLIVERVEPDWRTKLLATITNPTIAYGLLLIGIYGLLFEGYNPGAVLPGVVGAISLITALFAFQILSVNYAGLALIGLGVGMIIAEFFVPSFGSLGLGGLIAFVVGSIILFDTDTPGMNIGIPIIAGVATVGGALIVTLVWVASRSMRRPVVTGTQAMIGATAEAFEDFTSQGRVRFGGELWNARTSEPVSKGQRVRITRVDGLWLWVEPL